MINSSGMKRFLRSLGGILCFFSITAFAESGGLAATGISADGQLVVSAASSPIDVSLTTPFVIDNSLDGDTLLAVGPGFVHSDASRTYVSVFGQQIELLLETEFPRGMVEFGDYIAVSGEMLLDGSAVAANVIRLGGAYAPGVSPIYLRGLTNLDFDELGQFDLAGIGVDASQILNQIGSSGLVEPQIVEILGVEGQGYDNGLFIVALSGAVVDSSGARGINGSGARGINGSGARGINGSGARGINGSGARGINGSGARGINGSGARGINGSGARGINGSGARGINSSYSD